MNSAHQLEWAGVVMVDQIVQQDAPIPTQVKLVANDGTAYLRTLRSTITETNGQGQTVLQAQSVITRLVDILKRSKTAVHWGSDDAILRAWSDFKPNGWGDSVNTAGYDILEYAKLVGALDPTSVDVLNGLPDAYSDWTFLQSMCMLFNCRMCQANGLWHFWPVNQHVISQAGTAWGSSSKLYKKSDATEISQTPAEYAAFEASTEPQLGAAADDTKYTQMAGGEIAHTVPLNSFRRSRVYRGQEWMNLAIRTGNTSAININANGFGLVNFTDPRSFFTGAQFLIEGTVQVHRAAQSGYSGLANQVQVRIKVNLDVGAYRYDPANGVWTTDQSTDRYYFLGTGQTISGGLDYVLPVSIPVAPLPADSETCAVVIQADFLNGIGGSLNSLFDDASPPTNLGCNIKTKLTNDAFQNLLMFQGECPEDNTDTFNQGQLVFGTVTDAGTNSGQLTVLSQYQSTTTFWDMSTWISSQTTTQAHINRLCVREAMSILRAGLPKRSGDIFIPGSMIIPSPLMTIKSADGSDCFMVTRCSYSADDRIGSFDRIQIEYDDTQITDNGTTGDPTDGSGGDDGGATDDDGSGGGNGDVSNPGSTKDEALGLISKIKFDSGGIYSLDVKSGQQVINADEVDDGSSTNKFTTTAEQTQITTNATNITALAQAVKTSSDGNGRGVYSDNSKSTSQSHMAVTSTTANLQAGTNTGLAISETSPGTIEINVQAGSAGSETEVTAITVAGFDSIQNAQITMNERVNFASAVTGITSSHITEGSRLYFTDARADARITAASIEDLSDVATMTPSTNQVLQWNGSSWTAGTVSGGGSSSLASADQTLSGARIINTNGNDLTVKDGTTPLMAFDDSEDTWIFYKPVDFRNSSGYTAGEIRLKEVPAAAGDEHIALKAPSQLSSSVTYVLPGIDGSAGQFIKTDGSGNLSFAAASGGGSSESYLTLQSSFYTGDANGDYIPLGGTLTETTSFQYYNQWVAPLAGEVVNARIFTTGSSAGASNLHFRKFNSATNLDTASATFTTSNQVKLFAFDSATFSAGDRCAFFFDPTGLPAGVSVTILIKLTHP